MKAIDLITEAALSDTVLFQSFNNNAEMSSRIISAIKDSIVLDSSYIQEQIIQIKRTKISPLADKVLQAFEDGDILLLYATKVKIPQSLPFFATKMQGKIKVIIFVNNYGSIAKSTINSEDKFLNISMKNLYVLMEAAYIAYKNAYYPAAINRSLGLMKISTIIYTNMILRIFNKEFSLSMDLNLYNKVSFCIGKFFLENVWMYTNKDIVFSYACNTIKSQINKADLYNVSQEYDSKNITRIDQLIQYLKEFSPRLGSLSFRYFSQCFMNTYKPDALFGLECLPYFLFIVSSSLLGAFIVNQAMVMDVCKQTAGVNKFYPELVKALN